MKVINHQGDTFVATPPPYFKPEQVTVTGIEKIFEIPGAGYEVEYIIDYGPEGVFRDNYVRQDVLDKWIEHAKKIQEKEIQHLSRVSRTRR